MLDRLRVAVTAEQLSSKGGKSNVQFLEEKLHWAGSKNRVEILRRQKVLALLQAAAVAANRSIPACVFALQRITQCCVKLLRWLRSALRDRLDRKAATPRRRTLYATL
jgi:hypothetical protein